MLRYSGSGGTIGIVWTKEVFPSADIRVYIQPSPSSHTGAPARILRLLLPPDTTKSLTDCILNRYEFARIVKASVIGTMQRCLRKGRRNQLSTVCVKSCIVVNEKGKGIKIMATSYRTSKIIHGLGG